MKTQIIPETVPVTVTGGNKWLYIMLAAALALLVYHFIKTKKENEQKKISDSDNGNNEHA